MAFSDFSFPQVQADLGLSVAEADLFASVAEVDVREEFAETVAEGATVALAINTEKAKSEFIIAPLLLELKRGLGGVVGLFSGIELNVDTSIGLNGVCDFILSKAARQFILSAPLVTIVEAKNDNLRSGLGQCIASMCAAERFNSQSDAAIPVVHGVVTTGSAWKFLRLEGKAVTIDLKEYYIDDVGKILGILRSIILTA